MERKKVLRTIISVGLLVALVAVIYVSQGHDPSNPHSGIDKNKFINGPNGHGFAVLNNQQPYKQCYPCHEKKGLGGESYCIACHEQAGLKIELPKAPK